MPVRSVNTSVKVCDATCKADRQCANNMCIFAIDSVIMVPIAAKR